MRKDNRDPQLVGEAMLQSQQQVKELYGRDISLCTAYDHHVAGMIIEHYGKTEDRYITPPSGEMRTKVE